MNDPLMLDGYALEKPIGIFQTLIAGRGWCNRGYVLNERGKVICDLVLAYITSSEANIRYKE
jgi:hypothetical protein